MIRKSISILSLVIVTAILYGSFLGRTPIHLNQDELGFSLNAYSIVKSGLDESGRFLPLYFWHLGVMWSTPMIVYLTALFLKLFPLSEVIVRLSSVIVGVTDVLLMYFLASKLFNSHKWGFIAAGLLLLTPVHFIQSRILLDNLYIVPFVILWLLFFLKFQDAKKPLFLFLAGITLGFGFYSYHAARIMMPFYLLTTIFILLNAKVFHPHLRSFGGFPTPILVIVGFVLPLLPLIPWTLAFPETLFLDQVRYTGIYDTSMTFFSSGIAALLSPESLGHRFNVFISYFNPVFLFLLGDASLIHSTSLHHPLGISQSAIRAGVFLLPFAIFLPLGIYQALKKKTAFNILIVIGFFTAPFAATLVGDHYRISRALVILPYAVLLVVYGIQFLLSQKNKILLLTYYLLLITIPLQFSYFLYDYFTDYRIRSYAWMKYNIPEALENVLEQESRKPTDTIYIDSRIEFIDRYWKFYTIKHHKESLLDKVVFVDPQTLVLEDLNSNSLIMLNFNHVNGLQSQIGPFRKISTILEPDGVSTFYLYRN